MSTKEAGNGSILLAGDDLEFPVTMTSLLESCGVPARVALAREEASAILEREKIAVIVVSSRLTDGDGLGWIEALRGRGLATPIVFVSGDWMEPEQFKRVTQELKVTLVVHVPINATVLAQTLARMVGVSESKVQNLDTPELNQLQSSYGASLPEKVRTLAQALHRVRRQPDDSGAFVEARLLAHRLKGSAGSFGFDMVGDAAARLEEALDQVELKGPSRAEAWSRIASVLTELVRAADRAAGEAAQHESLVPGARVLVVDDDVAFLDAVAHVARRSVLGILTARDQDEALRLAQRTVIDAALLDLHLERGSGEELARRLRALPGYENLPMAFISGDTSLPSRIAAAHAGGSLFLCKPVEADVLTAAIHDLLALGRAARPHVLILDDDAVFAEELSQILQRNGMQVSTCRDCGSVLEVLSEIRPDVLLMDMVMPHVSGLDVCRMLRTTLRWHDLPILVLTGQTGVEGRVAAFESGADDYLAKPVVEAELLARIRVRLERAKLLRERSEKDPLTGLLQRRAFSEGFAARLQESRRTHSPMSMCMLDLDHFKQINDRFGHLAGDRVLAGLGKLLGRRMRGEDLRGRWGGEEFVLALPGQTSETAWAIVERLLAELQTMNFVGDRGELFGASFSAGISTWPDDGDSFEALLHAADARLYQAKDAGRGRVVGVMPPLQAVGA